MFRATRALMAMMTVGAFACTFSHSGLLPGGPSNDDAGAGGSGASPDTGAPETGGGGDTPDDGGTQDDADPTDGTANGDETAPDSPSPPDLDASQAADAVADAAAETVPPSDVVRDCTTLPNGAAFTPPAAAKPHCYWSPPTTNNWLGAANDCMGDRGHLVTLGSDEETAFVLTRVMGLKPADHVWVGGTDGRFSGDSAGSGPYAWITGEPMTYTSWFSDMKTQEPDGACETKCMGNPCNCEHRIAIMADGHWLDAYEGGLMRFVCEAEM